MSGENRKYHFDFAGGFFDDSEKTFFDNYILENGLNEYVTYHGIVGGKEKKELLKNCDIFTLPTRYLNEGQPISILEAMGNAMFIVSTDHAGIPDIVKDEVNGYVFSDDDAERIYNRLLELDMNRLKVIAIQNRHYCMNNFTQKQYQDKMKSIFKLC